MTVAKQNREPNREQQNPTRSKKTQRKTRTRYDAARVRAQKKSPINRCNLLHWFRFIQGSSDIQIKPISISTRCFLPSFDTSTSNPKQTRLLTPNPTSTSSSTQQLPPRLSRYPSSRFGSCAVRGCSPSSRSVNERERRRERRSVASFSFVRTRRKGRSELTRVSRRGSLDA